MWRVRQIENYVHSNKQHGQDNEVITISWFEGKLNYEID
jgi:hypothetical protein